MWIWAVTAQNRKMAVTAAARSFGYRNLAYLAFVASLFLLAPLLDAERLTEVGVSETQAEALIETMRRVVAENTMAIVHENRWELADVVGEIEHMASKEDLDEAITRQRNRIIVALVVGVIAAVLLVKIF
jgi:hypothetical protein